MTTDVKQRILLTGATGFIGSALLRTLSARPRTIVRVATRRRDASFSDDVEVVHIDGLTESVDCSEAVTGVDVIIHAAARVHVMKETAADPLTEFRRVNVEGTRRLARDAAAAGVRRIVFLSTIKVNGESTPKGRPFKATDAPSPSDPYAQSKLEAELELAELARQTGLEVVIVRSPLVYGPGVKANFERLMQLVKHRVPIPLGAVRNKRSMIYVDNLADLLARCVDVPTAGDRTLLASDGHDLSTPKLISMIAQAMGHRARLFSVPEPLLRLAGYVTRRH